VVHSIVAPEHLDADDERGDPNTRWPRSRTPARLDRPRERRHPELAPDASARRRFRYIPRVSGEAGDGDGDGARDAAAVQRVYDEFLATLSHELRGPLGVIIGWVDILRSDRLSAVERARALEIVDRNARLQARLIEDLVEASRVAGDRVRLELGPVAAVELVLGVVEALRPLAAQQGIELVATADPAFTLRGDGLRLGQVVHNVVGNALRYTPAGGRVTVSLTRDPQHATFVVADTGQGIEPALLPRVFDRFRQGTRVKVGGTRGLGLGLYIARHLVALHGGTIAAASAGKDQGARFTITLPLAGPDAG
jgi:signal transduction histidine kinase